MSLVSEEPSNLGKKRLRKALSMGRQSHTIATSTSTVLCANGVCVNGLKMRRGRREGGGGYGVYLIFGIEVVGEIRVEIESMDHIYKTLAIVTLSHLPIYISFLSAAVT